MIARRSLLAGLAALPAAAWGRPPEKPRFTAGPLVATGRLRGVVAYARLDRNDADLADAALAAAPMMPASTLKAVTALYALDRLGLGPWIGKSPALAGFAENVHATAAFVLIGVLAVYIAAACIYLAINLCLAALGRYLEHRTAV